MTDGRGGGARRVVVTGSTRGIGLGLAHEFLARGCSVLVVGRSPDGVEAAITSLTDRGHDRERIAGASGDVASTEAVCAMWDAAQDAFGGVDVWINNAGVNQRRLNVWELGAEEVSRVVDVNLLGAVNGSRVAIARMLAAGGGAVFNMEGFGSDGRVAEGITVYGATKRAIRYLTKALAKEVAGTPVTVGNLSPGIVITDLLLDDADPDPERRAKAMKVFNILGDTVETVTPFLAERVLAGPKNGARIAWLTPAKAAGRFASAPFRKRDLVDVGRGS